MKKKVWLINPYGPIEGENWREYSFNQFGKFLSEKEYEVVWWTASFSHHFKKQRSDGWKDIPVNENFIIRLVPTTGYKKNFGGGRLFKDFVFARNMLKHIEEYEKPDIIVAAENPITMGRPSFTYAKKNNVPMIYDQMDIWPEFIVKSLKMPLSKMADLFFIPVYKKRKQMYDYLDGSIALGKHYLEFMYNISPSLTKKPSALIYNGIDVDEFRSHLKEKSASTKIPQKEKGEKWCIFAGTLGPSYDIPNIIDCAEKFEKTGNCSFKFFIAGSGPYEELVCNKEKTLNNLIYLGKLLPEEIIPIYGKCDIGLSAYTAGSNVDMPDKFYDYTAAGLAVVNSLSGEIAEHISNEQVGENYKPADRESLYRALRKFDDIKYLERVKENSYNIAMKFDKNVQNRKLLSVIEKILE